MIPADLPPKTGPCPHCSGVVTSPQLDALVAPVAAFQPPPPPAPPAEIPPAPVSLKTPVKKQPPQPVSTSKNYPPKTSKPRRRSLIPAMLIPLALFLLALGGVYYTSLEMSQNIDPPTVKATSGDPKVNEANYMAATCGKDKIPFVLNGGGVINDSDTPADAFRSMNSPRKIASEACS